MDNSPNTIYLDPAQESRLNTAKDHKSGDYSALFIAVTVLLMAPLAFAEYLPMPDLPGHIARLHILLNYYKIPEFQKFYALNLRPVPNLALELIILPLAHLMSLSSAARVCVALTVAAFALGCWTLSKSIHGRITPFAVLALFALYNSTFFYGFISFHFGVGLALTALGLWYRWRERWTFPKVAALTAFAILIYLCHLGGYMYLAIGIGWLTLVAWRERRRLSPALLAGLLPLVPPPLFYLSLGKSRGDAGRIFFRTVAFKLQHAMILLTSYDRRFDSVIALLLIIAAAAAFRYGSFRFVPGIGSLAFVFAALFVLIPTQMLTGGDADARMIPGAAVFLLMGLTCHIPPQKGKIIYAIALTALVARVAFCGWIWKEQSDMMAGQVAFLNHIPEGSRIYPLLHLPENAEAQKFTRVLLRVSDFATVNRQAIDPLTFAVPGQHALVERTPLWMQNKDDPAHQGKIDWDHVARDYDTIWEYGRDPEQQSLIDHRFQLVAQYGSTRLFRIAH